MLWDSDGMGTMVAFQMSQPAVLPAVLKGSGQHRKVKQGTGGSCKLAPWSKMPGKGTVGSSPAELRRITAPRPAPSRLPDASVLCAPCSQPGGAEQWLSTGVSASTGKGEKQNGPKWDEMAQS